MTIFEKIINGELPAHKIYEDDQVLAFLDINPKGVGHTLLIPKTSYTYVWDIPDQEYQYIMQIAKKLALHLKKVMQTEFTRLDIVGTDVPHAHIHLIPFDLANESIEKPALQLTPEQFTEIAQKLYIDKL